MEWILLPLLLSAFAASPVQSRSTGAPVEACTNSLTPQHSGITSQTSSSPFELDVKQFEDLVANDAPVTYSYRPSTTYNREQLYKLLFYLIIMLV